MTNQFRISGKNLGALALPDFCPRCFWLKWHAPSGLPYQVFPGIFSSIDSYSKKIIHSYFDRHNKPPEWLSDLGEITGYITPPHHSRFSLLDDDTNILLTGDLDGVLVRSEHSNVIVDYKTARYTDTQDALLPQYEIQLNSYALIGEAGELSPVSGLALIYTEPMTDDDAASDDRIHESDRFSMNFSISVHPVQLETAVIKPYLEQARKIYDLPAPPSNREGCRDCSKLDGLLNIANNPSSD